MPSKSCITYLIILLVGFTYSNIASAQTNHPISSTALSAKSSLVNDNTVFDFSSARFGQIITHSFTFQNKSTAPLIISHLQPTCGCIILTDKGSTGNHAPISPGGTCEIKVALDTAQIPDFGATTLMGEEINKQVWVYAAGDNVHPYAILEMKGRITRGVSFSASSLEFGRVDQAKGISKTVQLTIDAELYDPERTRLSPGSSPFQITAIEATTLKPSGSGNHILRDYRITLPPHSPIGPLSGLLIVEGLKELKSNPTPVAGKFAPPPITNRLPYVGEIVGNVSAQPYMAVFGLVRRPKVAFVRMKEEDIRQRTRYILLISPKAAQSAKSGVKLAKSKLRSRKPTPSFWQSVTLQSDTPYFHAAIETPSPTSRPIPPGLKTGTSCWLRITLTADAPRKTPLNGNVNITFPDGERMRIPILAERE